MNSRIVSALIGSLAILAACGTSVEGPSANDIEQSIAVDLPVGYEVGSITIEAAENVGSEVQPRYRTRAIVEFALTENFYETVGEIDGTPLVQLSGEAGQTISGVMITESEPTASGWNVDPGRTDVPRIDGQAESQFGLNGFVVEDSPEHEAAIEAQEQEEARALRALQDQFLGTWQSTAPMQVNNRVYQRNDRQAGFELNFRPSAEHAGSGTAKIFVLGNPTDFVSADFAYDLMRPGGQTGENVSLQFSERVTHQGLGFFTTPSAVWHLYPNGRFETHFHNNTWSAQLRQSE